jgi:hypothetical protein
MSAHLSFDGGQGGEFAVAKLSFEFDAKTLSFTRKSIEYELSN